MTWEPLTLAATKETDELIRNIVGLSRETFRDSVYLRQGDGGYADPDRDPRQRKELLVEAVLGRDPVWPRLAERARARRKEAQQRLERIRGETESLREPVNGLSDTILDAQEAADAVTEAAADVAAAEAHLAKVSTRYQAAREQAAARQTLEAELREAHRAVTALEEREAAAAAAVLAIDTARDELEALPQAGQTSALEADERDYVQALATYRDFVATYERAQREHEIAFRRRTELIDKAQTLLLEEQLLEQEPLDEARCDHCGQLLGAEAREERLAKYRTDIAALNAEAQAVALPHVPAKPEMPTINGATIEEMHAATLVALERSRAADAQRARLEERITQLQQTADAKPPVDEIATQRSRATEKRLVLDALEPVNLDVVEAEGRVARAAVQAGRDQHQAAIAAKARCDERLTRLRAAKQKLVELEGTIKTLQADVDRDLVLERAYGRDGIPALIIENTAIPYLETEAGRILSLLGTSFQVELRTLAENKTGGLRDTLDVVVIDQDGNEAGYEDGCSGGEQTRIGLALRIALARLLATRRGAESRLLALDEPSYLDQAGMVALLDVLRGLDQDFDLILLVSHVPELRDSLDQVITVVKEAGRSTIAGAPDREPVAA